MCLSAGAQQTGGAADRGNLLPESSAHASAQQEGPAQSRDAASLSGTILDQNGAPIEGGRVVVLDAGGRQVRVGSADASGRFSFYGLPAGTFQVSVSSAGFAPRMSNISLSVGQVFILPEMRMGVAVANTDIHVTVSRQEIATEQIKAAEKQRIIGVFPNFFTSYVYDAVPLTTKQKYSLTFRDTFDPIRFVTTGIGAGIEQANNSYAGYGQGAAGYGKRYAALYGNGMFSDVLSRAVFPSIFHQDPRYFYQGTGTFKSRALHGIGYGFVLRGDSGKTELNYSYFLGDLSAGALSNLYYPHADRGGALVFRNAAIGIGGRAASGLIREFIVPYFTRHKAGSGKP